MSKDMLEVSPIIESTAQHTESLEDPAKSCKLEVLEETEKIVETNIPTENQPNEFAVSGKIDKVRAPDDNIKQVYGWSAAGVGERQSEADKFYKTQLFNAILYKLQNTESSLNQISGLQGTGKTRLLTELARTIKKSARFKLTSNWKENLLEYSETDTNDFFQDYWENLRWEYNHEITNLQATGQNAKLRRAGEVRTIIQRDNTSSMEEFLGKAKIKQLKDNAFIHFIRSRKVIFIDMPDYSKSNANAMTHDIDEIQELYESLQNCPIHFVIAVQRELMQKAPHFFWGKCDKYTLEPLTTDQLIELYNLNNQGPEIFEPTALQYLAELSRGVPRRFKRYIRLTIEANREQKLPMDIELVKTAITENVLFEDLDQELANVFEKEESRRIASRILNYLRGNKDSNIKTIAESVGISETIAQKTVQRLLLYGYVTSRHGEGKEKLVSLQL
jgi:hypothetical protein